MTRKGDKGAIVKQIQAKLGLVQDGVFGSKTEAKVIEFQKKNKLVADGIVGESTLKALRIVLDANKKGISEEQYQSIVVKQIQGKLGLVQDGVFGPNTEAKVIEFQKKNKLIPDGIVGEATLKAFGIVLDVSKKGISEEQYQSAAKSIGCKIAAIKAVDMVEAGGSGFLFNGEVKILFEPHVFWRELVLKGVNPNKYLAGNSDILYQKWKTGSYGASNIQWAKMHRAMAINKEAAMKSASYGRYQIMGNNHKVCGYNTVGEFVSAMEKSEYVQLCAFISFVKSNKLDKFLINEDWAKFANGYNGSGYKANRYDVKILEAFKQFSK